MESDALKKYLNNLTKDQLEQLVLEFHDTVEDASSKQKLVTKLLEIPHNFELADLSEVPMRNILLSLDTLADVRNMCLSNPLARTICKDPIFRREWKMLHGGLPLQGHTGWVSSVAWSPDGTKLASGSFDKSIRIWNVATAESIVTLKGEREYVRMVAWSPDGTKLAWGSGRNILIQNVVTNNRLILEGHTEFVRSVSWSPNSTKLASGSADGSIRIWKFSTKIGNFWNDETAKSLATLKGDTRDVWSVAWNPKDDTKLASGDSVGTVRIWKFSESPEIGNFWNVATAESIANRASASTVPADALIATLEGHTQTVNSVAWSPDGTKLASGGEDKSIRIWNAATAESIATLLGDTGWVYSVAWSPDGTKLASSGDGSIQIWNVVTAESIATLQVRTATEDDDELVIWCVAWSPDGTKLASDDDRNIRIWDVTRFYSQ